MAQIEHIVVLMMENRSFDHMLGFLKRRDYPIEGLSGNETNLFDPHDPASRPIKVTPDATYQGDTVNPDPTHDLVSVNIQLFGERAPGNAAPGNGGFVFNYGMKSATPETIMRCFNAQSLPTLSSLAREFAVCDHWHASVPGPTWPNRIFAHAATSDGHVDNKLHPYLMRTLYDNLNDFGKSWRLYFHDFPQAAALASLQKHAADGHFKLFRNFLSDAANNALPAYSFIEPRYADFLLAKSNDQHPDHDVIQGEFLIADVYEALRASSAWERSLLVVVYDEHGGIFDHVPPPQAPIAINPDGKNSNDPEFRFDRLGVRVPAVLVSPLIPRGTIDSTIYDHTAIPASVKKIFGLPHFLTQRDAISQTFERVLTLPVPRADTPATLPRPGASAAIDTHRRFLGMAMDRASIQDGLARDAFSLSKLSDSHESLVALANSLALPNESDEAMWLRRARLMNVEHDVAVHLQDAAHRFFDLK